MLLPLFHSWCLLTDKRIRRYVCSCEKGAPSTPTQECRENDHQEQVLSPGPKVCDPVMTTLRSPGGFLAVGRVGNEKTWEGAAAVAVQSGLARGSCDMQFLFNLTSFLHLEILNLILFQQSPGNGLLQVCYVTDCFSLGKSNAAFISPVYTSILSNAFSIQRPLLNPSWKRKLSLEGTDWRNRLEVGITINSQC